MEIQDRLAPLLVGAVRDAVSYHELLLQNNTLADREDYEEHFLQLTQFFEHVKELYKRIEDEVGLPLDKIVPP